MTRRAPIFISLAAALCAIGLRRWTLAAAVDQTGLPVMHHSVYVLLAAGALFLVLSLLCALRSPGRSGRRDVLYQSPRAAVLSMISGGLMLLGAVLYFIEALQAGPGITAPILLLLGLLGGIGAMTAAYLRREKRSHPGPELLPAVYLLIKLVLDFKHWSTDPIILDYCFLLFASIFTLLTVFRGTGFSLNQGKPRRTLFDAMAACFFCSCAMMDGLHLGTISTTLTYLGLMLWGLAMMPCLTAPRAANPQK